MTDQVLEIDIISDRLISEPSIYGVTFSLRWLKILSFKKDQYNPFFTFHILINTKLVLLGPVLIVAFWSNPVSDCFLIVIFNSTWDNFYARSKLRNIDKGKVSARVINRLFRFTDSLKRSNVQVCSVWNTSRLFSNFADSVGSIWLYAGSIRILTAVINIILYTVNKTKLNFWTIFII